MTGVGGLSNNGEKPRGPLNGQRPDIPDKDGEQNKDIELVWIKPPPVDPNDVNPYIHTLLVGSKYTLEWNTSFPTTTFVELMTGEKSSIILAKDMKHGTSRLFTILHNMAGKLTRSF
jgi:hypothetical protein